MMTTLTREQANRQAVKSAGERLARLEEEMHRLFYLAVATVAMLTITTGIVVYGAYRYWQVRSAMSQSMERLEKMPPSTIRFSGQRLRLHAS